MMRTRCQTLRKCCMIILLIFPQCHLCVCVFCASTRCVHQVLCFASGLCKPWHVQSLLFLIWGRARTLHLVQTGSEPCTWYRTLHLVQSRSVLFQRLACLLPFSTAFLLLTAEGNWDRGRGDPIDWINCNLHTVSCITVLCQGCRIVPLWSWFCVICNAALSSTEVGVQFTACTAFSHEAYQYNLLLRAPLLVGIRVTNFHKDLSSPSFHTYSVLV